MEKMTRVQYFEMLKDIVVGTVEDEAIVADLTAFLDKQVESLAKKAERAKEKAAEKKADGDALRALVHSVLTETAQTVDEIVAQVEGEDITRNKVIARLTQLVKAEVVEKEQVTVDKRRIMAYKLADISEPVEDAE